MATTAVVVGAGHSGLAMSRRLTERSIDHVVLERGSVGHSWRTQRWDTLRLLTPNWMTRLPGWAYDAEDPDGYQSAHELAHSLRTYAERFRAPVVEGVTVTSVRPHDAGFLVETDQGPWEARSVVLAVGSTVATRPACASEVPRDVHQVSALDYRNPGTLPGDGVLVVGAGASGVQIAEELQRSGRPVTLAVGEHVRVPRSYQGHDILWWMDRLGLLDESHDMVDDLVRARHVPSPQLIGAARTIDLNTLMASGVRVVGRLAGIRDREALFAGALQHVCALADLKMGRLLDAIDAYAGARGDRLEPTEPAAARLRVDLASGEVGSVVWATGNRPDFSWVQVPIFDRRDRLVHNGGVTSWPGLYVLGLPFLRRRRSTYVDGARADSDDLAAHLVGYLRSSAGHRSPDAS